MSTKPMAQPLRALMGTMNALSKLKVGPSLESVMNKPHADRIAHLNPAIMARKVTADISTEDVEVEGRGGKIAVRVYKRPDTPPGAPGYLFIHGGGFALGGVAFCDHVCRELADRSGFVVVGLSYRLAPDFPFPAGIEDCQDVFTWMAKEAPGGLDPEKLFVGGESAGGNFTSLLAIWARDNNGPRILQHSPIYPLTDFTAELIDWSEGNAGNPGVTPAVWDMAGKAYCQDHPKDDPLLSPRFADHAGLPPALVVTCGHDILRNEGIALAESYRAAGVETTHVHMEDMPHGHLLATRLTKRAYETMDLMVAEAKK
ncbi:MAG: alpha/beta hydrolase fold protein, partial [Frankiales bacterium]|nr:alpha/beta hydrolase fold protein [Frankiales bacterium]